MMSQPPARPAAPAPPTEGWELHWQALKRLLDVRLLAATCAVCVVIAFAALALNVGEVRAFYYDMNFEVNHRDLHELNSLGDIMLQDYLRDGNAADGRDCVIIGASIVATSYDIDPLKRLHRRLQAQLREQTAEDWQVTNLATNGAVTWSNFYIARLLRLERPPAVLIASLDATLPRDRNLHLVLDVGVRRGDLTVRELEPVLELNRQPLYVCEANLKKWLREHCAFFAAWNFASYSYPTRENIAAWLRFTAARLRGQPPPALALGGSYHADGTPKSWRELPESRARIEMYQRTGGHRESWNAAMPAEYEQLFAELARLQQQGTRVIVVSMPRNPACPQQLGPLPDFVRAACARYGLQFHDYWLSALIPDEYYVDQGHFFGAGNEIMAAELARLILAPPAGGSEEAVR